MNRRSFLHSLAASSAALAAHHPNLTAAQPSRPSLGFSLYGMKTVPLTESLQICKRLGYQHVEIALNKGYPTEPTAFSESDRRDLAKQLRAIGLAAPCLMVNLSLVGEKSLADAITQLKHAATFAHQLDPEHPPIIETVLGGKPTEWDQLKEGMTLNLKRWAEIAESERITIALKAHINSAVNSPERLLELLRHAPSPALAVAYDYSHFQLQGIGMQESMKALLPKTRFIHVKDSVPTDKGFQFVLPGQGSIDYPLFFRLLREHQYAGPVCVEVSGQVFSKPGYDPKDAAAKSYAALAAPLEKAFS